MSIINKKPYIETVLETLTKQNLSTLIGLINGGEGNVTFKSYINTSYAFSTDDKGIKRIVLETKDNIFTGYLIYNNSHCVIVAYDNSLNQKLRIVKLDYENDKYEIIDEILTINEFRRLIEGRTTNLVVESNDVVANPENSATEVLHKIKIDGVIYDVYKAPVLLWENQAPNENMNAQYLTIPNLGNYDYLIIGYKTHGSADNGITYRKVKVQQDKYFNFVDVVSGEHMYSRGFQFASNTSLRLLAGYYNTTESATCIIPVEIYGTNNL